MSDPSGITLKRDVEAELRWDHAIDATDIGVAVKNGVVTLTGFVPSYMQKYEAEDDAKVLRISGFGEPGDDLLAPGQIAERKQQHQRDEPGRAPVDDLPNHGASGVGRSGRRVRATQSCAIDQRPSCTRSRAETSADHQALFST